MDDPKRKDTICIYNYYPVDLSYTKNMEFFLEWTRGSFSKTFITYPRGVKLPVNNDVEWIEVENSNQDFGSLSFVLTSRWNEIQGKNIFVCNSSVLGPLGQDLTDPHSWLQTYVQALGDKCGMAGDSLNPGWPWMPHSISFRRRNLLSRDAAHVQTTNFILSGQAAQILHESGLFDPKGSLPKRQIIEDFEIGMSHYLRGKGLGLTEVLKNRNRPKSLGYLFTGDAHSGKLNWLRRPLPGDYFFLKTNRGLYTDEEIIEFARENPLNQSRRMSRLKQCGSEDIS